MLTQEILDLNKQMYTDEQLVPISALQHLVFCVRQCALIHVERVWSENALTAEGQLLHKKTNTARDESHLGVRLARSLDLVSRRLGLIGRLKDSPEASFLSCIWCFSWLKRRPQKRCALGSSRRDRTLKQG